MIQGLNSLKLLIFLVFSLAISSCQTREMTNRNSRDNELNALVALLIKPSDFNQDDYFWEKEFYSFEKQYHASGAETAQSNLAGKQVETQFDFLLIQAITKHNSDSIPEINTEQYAEMYWHEVSLPNFTEDHDAYCFSSEADNLASCIVIMKNDFLISTIEVRVFMHYEPTALEIVTLGAKLFVERLNSSELR